MRKTLLHPEVYRTTSGDHYSVRTEPILLHFWVIGKSGHFQELELGICRLTKHAISMYDTFLSSPHHDLKVALSHIFVRPLVRLEPEPNLV